MSVQPVRQHATDRIQRSPAQFEHEPAAGTQDASRRPDDEPPIDLGAGLVRRTMRCAARGRAPRAASPPLVQADVGRIGNDHRRNDRGANASSRSPGDELNAGVQAVARFVPRHEARASEMSTAETSAPAIRVRASRRSRPTRSRHRPRASPERSARAQPRRHARSPGGESGHRA